MGSCCSAEKKLRSLPIENYKLTRGNLLILQGIESYCIEIRFDALVLKLMKIFDITEKYYKKLNEERSETSKRIPTMSEKQVAHFLEMLEKENNLLANAKKNLLRLINKYSNRSYSIDTIEMYIDTMKVDKKFASKKKELVLLFVDCKKKVRDLDSLILSKNKGEPFNQRDTKFIRDICKQTTFRSTCRNSRLNFYATETQLKETTRKNTTRAKNKSKTVSSKRRLKTSIDYFPRQRSKSSA